MKLSINTGSQLSKLPQAILNTLIAQMYDFNFKEDEEDEHEVYFRLKG